MHIVFYLLGIVLLIAATNMDTSVSVSTGGAYGFGSPDVVNLQALQYQMMTWQAALASILAGAILTPRKAPAAIVPREREHLPIDELDDEERDARLEAVRRLNRTIGLILCAIALGVIALIAFNQ